MPASPAEIPDFLYKRGTKSFDVAYTVIFQGANDPKEISKRIGVNVKTVYNVKAKIKQVIDKMNAARGYRQGYPQGTLPQRSPGNLQGSIRGNKGNQGSSQGGEVPQQGNQGSSQGNQGTSQGNQGSTQGNQGSSATQSSIGTQGQYIPPPPPQSPHQGTGLPQSPHQGTALPQKPHQGTVYPQVYPPENGTPQQLPKDDPRTIVMYPYKFADGRVMHFPTRLGDIEQQESGDLTVTDLLKKSGYKPDPNNPELAKPCKYIKR